MSKKGYKKYELRDCCNCEGWIVLGDESESVPEWLDLLQTISQKELPKLSNKSNRALLILKIDERFFVFSFGYGRYMLKNESYVHRFGIKVVLNSVNPDNILQIDKLTMEELPVRSQIQASKFTNIYSFGIDVYADYMRGVKGCPENDELGNIIAGKDDFKFSRKVGFSEFKELCNKILIIYQSNKYKDNYDWYDHFKEIDDPELLHKLDNILMNVIQEYSSEKIYLSPLEFVDYPNIEFSYTERGDKFEYLRIEDFFDYLKGRSHSINLESLKKRKVYVWRDNGENEKWSIYNCLIFEYLEDNILYVMTNGTWFEVENDFVKEVDNYLQGIPESSIKLPNYNHKNEGEYNNFVGQNTPNLISLDRTTPWLEDHRGKIEICDLFSNEGHLIHVKRWNSSSTLSHLFAQGRLSATSLINSLDYREKVREEIKKVDETFLEVLEDDKISSFNFHMVYAIIYKEDKPLHKRLPFFSKLNMRQSVQQLREMQFNVEKIQIKDVYHK